MSCIDIFSQKYNLYFDKEKSLSTSLGSIVSFIIIALNIGVLIFFSLDTINRKKPHVDRFKKPELSELIYIPNMAIGIYGPNVQSQEDWKKYFNIKVNAYVDNKSKINLNSDCKRENFKQMDTILYDRLSLPNAYCIAEKDNLRMDFFQIELTTCQNKTFNDQNVEKFCATPELIHNKFNNHFIGIVFEEEILNTEDPGQQFYIHHTVFMKLSYSNIKSLAFQSFTTEVVIDEGIITESFKNSVNITSIGNYYIDHKEYDPKDFVNFDKDNNEATVVQKFLEIRFEKQLF